MDWHDPSCRRADLVPLDGPTWTCMACGSIGSIDSIPTTPPPQANAVSQGFIRPLWWPASAVYSTRHVCQALTLEGLTQQQEEVVFANGPNIQNSLAFAHKRESKPYIHSDLSDSSHIRLLELLPGARLEALYGRLLEVQCDQSLDYGALSYTWADADNDAALSRRIFLDDDRLPLPITLSCDRALRSLRQRYTPIRIWVDSICINQSSSTERSHQVSLMHSVYSNASTVHVYVGEEEHGSFKKGAEAMAALAITNEPFSSTDRETLNVFFSRPYFSRLWVVQEVLLARFIKIHCGVFSLVLSRDTISRLREQGVTVPPWIGLIGLGAERSSIDLVKLLSATAICGVTDWRDKIFGLLGLVQDAPLEQLTADYDLMVREVFIGVATYLLQRHQRFDVLELVNSKDYIDNRQKYGIPSWVPVWDSSQSALSAAGLLSSRKLQLERDCREQTARLAWDAMGIRFIDGWHDANIEYSGKEVDAVTGALVTAGREILRLGGPPAPKFHSHMEDTGGQGFTSFWKFSGGALLALHGPRTVLIDASSRANNSPLRLIRIQGCKTLFLASRMPNRPGLLYELKCPCTAAIIYETNGGDSQNEGLSEDLYLLEQCFPLRLEDVRFFFTWRRVLTHRKDVEHFEPALNDDGEGSIWPTSLDGRTEIFWTRYREAVVHKRPCSSQPELQSEFYALFGFWDDQAFSSVEGLIKNLDMKSICATFDNWLSAIAFLSMSVSDNPDINRAGSLYKMELGELKWSGYMKNKLDDWHRGCMLLPTVFKDLTGCDLIVESFGEEVRVTPRLGDEVYWTVRSLPAKCNSGYQLEQELKGTPIIKSVDRSHLQTLFYSMFETAYGLKQTRKMVEGRRLVQKVFELDGDLTELIDGARNYVVIFSGHVTSYPPQNATREIVCATPDKCVW
ncbi:heterokaryon incompatibility het-6 [Fusarium albosuccineum]|uniref:Heterokaryon incompatibility het-6 n=1 Tax=Fusarium albosuccineum TaxID=1237068 RepID=A0A8H4PIS9_9HYPO|nr:heterokaryon incompatibility het-6 [Fusarium albosuccineum]